ncbi:g3732 [Coccomyxa viridis]|uniref:G3732 protein n=1 Tax=Coccomyxa viridis TaxID=1274662 RepID=A0ABP1FRU1_9CHLO
MRTKGSFVGSLATFCVLLASLRVNGEAQAPQADALDTAQVVSLLAKSGKTNGTRSGESNSKISVLIGGASAFASSTTDGTGNGDTTGGSGNNNGNNATGSGNGNGNGNNNAIITIQNDPTFLTCPPCQYYDPAQQLCISVQACLATKPSPSPAPTSGAATAPAVTAPAVTAATPAAAGTFTTTAGRKLLESWGQHLMPLWQSSG